MNLKFISGIALLALFSTAALGQVKSHEQLVTELVDVMGIKEQAQTTVDGVMSAVSQQSQGIIENMVLSESGLSAAEKEKARAIAKESYERFMKSFRERVFKQIDIARTVEEIAVALYTKYFSDQELSDLIAFYKTPTGKKSMQVLPSLATESIQMAQEKMGPTLEKIVKELLEEERKAVNPKGRPAR